MTARSGCVTLTVVAAAVVLPLHWLGGELVLHGPTDMLQLIVHMCGVWSSRLPTLVDQSDLLVWLEAFKPFKYPWCCSILFRLNKAVSL